MTACPLPVRGLAVAHDAFRRWLGASYDLAALDVVLAAAAVEQLDGDPVWLLVVSGSGNAKTETVAALAGAGALVTSTITSEGALLSATSRKERSSAATGGLLRRLGPRGLLVVKDVTSILSMNRDARAGVLAALREVYDGKWERNVGTDGGRSLLWEGRLGLIGAVTTAWDTHHGVVATMGDRFALVRVDSSVGRLDSGRQALRNVGHEEQMRGELAAAVGAALVDLDHDRVSLDEQHMTALLGAANLVTLARTAVERDQRGTVLEAHAPEAPTRFAKMLGQLVRGAQALGADDARALDSALRVAGDSVPPTRLRVLAAVQAQPGSSTTDLARTLQQPRSSVDRALVELQAIGLVVADDLPGTAGWRWHLHESVDRAALEQLVTRKVSTRALGAKEEREPSPHVPADISGDGLWGADIPGDARQVAAWPGLPWGSS